MIQAVDVGTICFWIASFEVNVPDARAFYIQNVRPPKQKFLSLGLSIIMNVQFKANSVIRNTKLPQPHQKHFKHVGIGIPEHYSSTRIVTFLFGTFCPIQRNPDKPELPVRKTTDIG